MTVLEIPQIDYRYDLHGQMQLAVIFHRFSLKSFHATFDHTNNKYSCDYRVCCST